MKQKTAIRQLIELTKQSFDCNHDIKAHAFLTMAEKLEPVNEQQIIDAYAGVLKDDKFAVHKALLEKGQQYFNETFEKP